ncbi:MAG TPA: T9SS type A sorting domain-containing protein [Ignavibacteria bacterium]|nr:T9SS type A sorting domain-containing protein [Ignavibacteria bacterium]
MIRILFILLTVLLLKPIPAISQHLDIKNNPYEKADDYTKSKKSFNRERWFYEQRMYPNNHLPEDAYGKASEQKNALRELNGFRSDPSTTWNNIGPTPAAFFGYNNVSGRITSVKYDPVNPDIIYVGGAFGGIWRTTDGGASFYPITDREITLSTGSIFIDPETPGRIFYGTGEATYSGVSYYGKGILISTDYGNTWVNSTQGLPAFMHTSRILVKPGNPNMVFAALGTEGLYWSTNGGTSWSLHVTGRVDDIVFEPTGHTGYLVGSVSGYRRSTDGGVTFSPAAGPTMGIRNHIAICKSTPSVLYISVYTGSQIKVYKSTNAGYNYSQVSTGHDFYPDQAWYNFYMHVNPFDPNFAYVGVIDVWRTTNGGSSFQNITNSYLGGNVHPDQHNMDFHPQNQNELVAVNDGGIWKSTNKGTNWINLNSNLSITQFYRISADPSNLSHIIGGTQDNGTQRTTGSFNWHSILGGDGGEVCFHSQNSSVILAEKQYNQIFRSTDGGTSWIAAMDGLTGFAAWIAPIVSHPSTPGVFYTAREKVFKSTNWGENWSPISTGTSGSIREMAISRSNPSTMYVSTGLPIYKSLDGGNTFISVTTGLQNRIITSIHIHPDSSNTVLITYAGFGAGKVYKTTNGGSSWQNISGNLPDTQTNDLLIYYPGYASSIYFAATDVGVFYTNDYGTEWIELADSLPNTAALNFDYHLSSNMIRVATHGRGVWELGNPIGIINYSSEIPVNFSLNQNYPNPFNPMTFIKYDILKEGFVKLAVYDILGRELKSIISQNQKAGTYTVQFDGSNLSSGVYFYKLQAKGFTETKKMMITK